MNDRKPHGTEIIARGLVVRDAALLLCRSVPAGYRYLPGGHVEPGEPAAAALQRELREETGVSTAAGRLVLVTEELFVQSGRARHELNLVFHVEHTPLPAAVPSREPQIAFDWIPWREIGVSGMLPARIADWLAARDPAAIRDAPVEWLPALEDALS